MLLDRLEERLRLIEASGHDRSGSVELGPPAGGADIPDEPPTESERLRLLALVAAHDAVTARLEGRRRALRQAQRYSMVAGS